MQRRARLRPLALAAAIAVALAGACRSSGGRRSAADDLRDAAGAAPLRVFATGDARGYVEPCGCEEGQVGGLPRRGTYLRASPRPGDVRVDLGNFTAGAGEVRRLRREAFLDAFAGLAYDAVVPGRAELADGADFETAARERGVAVVAANVVGADGRLVWDPWRVVALADGRKVAVVGIAEAADRLPPGRSVTAPDAALRRAVAELAGTADAVLAATSLSAEAARALADAVPGVALVLSGSTPEPDVPFAAGGGALVGTVGHLGGYVARVDFGADLAPATTWRAWLDERVADDPAMAAVVRRYRDANAEIDRRYVAKVADGHRAGGFAGSLACAPCHRAELAVWRASRHATAMATLVRKETSRDPDCVPCHLVDVPEDRASWDPDALGVGCEACHGPSAKHAADPETRTPVPDGGMSRCVSQCHHPPEVKHFDPAAQWPRIRHGGK